MNTRIFIAVLFTFICSCFARAEQVEIVSESDSIWAAFSRFANIELHLDHKQSENMVANSGKAVLKPVNKGDIIDFEIVTKGKRKFIQVNTVRKAIAFRVQPTIPVPVPAPVVATAEVKAVEKPIQVVVEIPSPKPQEKIQPTVETVKKPTTKSPVTTFETHNNRTEQIYFQTPTKKLPVYIPAESYIDKTLQGYIAITAGTIALIMIPVFLIWKKPWKNPTMDWRKNYHKEKKPHKVPRPNVIPFHKLRPMITPTNFGAVKPGSRASR